VEGEAGGRGEREASGRREAGWAEDERRRHTQGFLRVATPFCPFLDFFHFLSPSQQHCDTYAARQSQRPVLPREAAIVESPCIG
jgi:hypothetical protein